MPEPKRVRTHSSDIHITDPSPTTSGGQGGFPPMGAFKPKGTILPIRRRDHDPKRDRLSVIGGLAALSLDAMASVSYGPEAIVIVLAAAGSAGLGFTLPVTAAIAGLLGVLVLSYRQVIASFPDGGGAYAVAKHHLSRRTSLVAAASLVVTTCSTSRCR